MEDYGATVFTATKGTSELRREVAAGLLWEEQCKKAANRACVDDFRLVSATSFSNLEMSILSYKAAIRSHLENCTHAWVPLLKKDVTCL